jgi:type IV fimbrial biogenesis protein FimT
MPRAHGNRNAGRVSSSYEGLLCPFAGVQHVMKRCFYSAKPSPGLSPRRVGGFTLVEAMVVIAISAILMVLAAPSMRNLIESNGVSDSVDSLTGSIAFARAEAIKRGVPVAICPSNAATTGTVACETGTEWANGWIVFVDYAGDGALATNDSVLRMQGSFTKNGAITLAPAGTLVFKPMGTLGSRAAGFTFASPSSISSLSKMVCVGLGGRARVVSGSSCS